MLFGAILTALGIVALVFRSGIHYTAEETAPHEGKVKITAPAERVVSISPVVGGLALAAGIGCMIAAARK